MKYGVVYRAFNTDTGKSYVGQAVQTNQIDALARRKKEHLRFANGRKNPFYSSLKSHGPNAFVWSELFRSFWDGAAKESAQREFNAAEQYWIAALDCVYPNGYNLRLGGESGGQHSESTKAKIAEKSRGNSSHLGHRHSAEVRARISERVKETRTPEMIARISAKNLGRKNSYPKNRKSRKKNVPIFHGEIS